MVTLGDDVHVIGGEDPHGQLCETFIVNQWKKQPDMRIGMISPIAAAAFGKLWVIENITIAQKS